MSTITEKAKNIRLLILDVDGILTSGHISYDNKDDERKTFHVHDGQGIKLLQKAGISVAIISGRKSEAVTKRAAELGIKAYLGHDDKVPPYEELKSNLQISDEMIAYMGDDLPDLPLLMRAGLALTVPNAPSYIQKHADMVSDKNGGDGAVREMCEYILKAQDKLDSIIATFVNR